MVNDILLNLIALTSKCYCKYFDQIDNYVLSLYYCFISTHVLNNIYGHTYINIYLIKGNNNIIPVINIQGTVYKCIYFLYIFYLDQNNDIIKNLYKFLFEKGTFLLNINFTGHRLGIIHFLIGGGEGRDLGKYCLLLFQIFFYASTSPLFILFFLYVL